MSRSRFLAIVVVIVAVVVAAPRPAAHVTTSEGRALRDEPTSGQRTGAPQTGTGPGPSSANSGPTMAPSGDASDGSYEPRDRSGAPKPSGGIGEPASYCKPQFCETPQPRIVDGISGEATWWYSFGGGFYVALRPDLGSKGDLVIVCGGAPFHCRTAPVITSCACLGPNSDRLVDLSRDLFAEFADPDRGVVRVVIQVIKGGTS